MPDSASSREPSIRDFLWEHENERHLGLFSAIGRIVVQWGQIEFQFSLNTTFLHTNLGGVASIPNPPRQSSKIGFWRKCFRDIPALKPYEKEASDFATKFSDAKTSRDNLLHHNWGVAFEENPADVIIGGGIKIHFDGHSLTRSEMHIQRLYDFTFSLAEINTELLRFSFLLTTTPLRQQFGKSE
jgi:hypothetical protein